MKQIKKENKKEFVTEEKKMGQRHQRYNILPSTFSFQLTSSFNVKPHINVIIIMQNEDVKMLFFVIVVGRAKTLR